jgi:dTMP kinase
MADKGLFIVFEGVDGGGKTTQINLLKEHYEAEDRKVILTREPTDTSIGQLIREYAESRQRNLSPETEALLFSADRREHSILIKKYVEEGYIVISDRYYHSTIAYQGAAGVDEDWIIALNKFALQPDTVILLDIDPEDSLRRVDDRDKTVFEELEYLKKVRAIFLNHAEKGALHVVDANQSIDQVHNRIKEHLKSS